ncbi:MAG TPA: helicase-associated domain-containing protein [Anaerolineales bacterium]|nr:helicase-associated domain-containing protein [Anaerolineales bacterium]
MPSLRRTLQDYDLGLLRVIAELWGLEMPPGRSAEAAEALARAILQSEEVPEIVEGLPEASRRALDWLLDQGGRSPVTDLQLQFGPLSRAGPGRRDREKPWRDRQAALDGLWYRGLIGLAFFETLSGPREFAFVPDELLPRLGRQSPAKVGLRSVGGPESIHPAGGAADDAVTLLAALRRRPARTDTIQAERAVGLRRFLVHPESLDLLIALLRGLDALIPSPLRPEPEAVRQLLRAGRHAIEASLQAGWLQSLSYNDLAHIPGLSVPSGRWPNDPVLSRRGLLQVVKTCSAGAWYDLDELVDWARDAHPTFLRHGGESDSWYLRETSSGRFLRGFEDWQSVEGAYLRFCLTGPLHWLGVVDLGREGEERQPARLRLRSAQFDGAPPEDDPGASDAPLARLAADGRIIFPRGASLPHRYQVARFAEWVGFDDSARVYRITPRALATAASQGLGTKGVVRILETATGRPLPEVLVRSMDRWSKRGSEVGLERAVLLRVKEPGILRQLQKDPATARYLSEIVSPTVARIQARDLDKLLSAAARRGLLIDPPTAESNSP